MESWSAATALETTDVDQEALAEVASSCDALRSAIKKGDIDVIQKLSAEKSILEYAKAPAHFVPYAFCMFRYAKVIAGEYFTPLQYAAIHDASDDGGVVKTLLSASCEVDHQGAMGVTPLNLATKNGNEGVVTALLDAGAVREGGDILGRQACAVAPNEKIESMLLGEPEYVQIASPRTSGSEAKGGPEQEDHGFFETFSRLQSEALGQNEIPTYKRIKEELIKEHGLAVFERNKQYVQQQLNDDAPITASPDQPIILDKNHSRLTWKKFSGRFKGDDSYMFGDLAHGLLSAAKMLVLNGKMSYKTDLPRTHLPPTERGAEPSITTFDFVPEDEVTRIEKIGDGASSTVYKSMWRGTYIAEKMLEIKDVGYSQSRMMTEIEILSTIRHDHIVKLYGAFCSDHLLCIYSEFADAGCLYSAIHSEGASHSDDSMLRWGVEVAAALAFLHGLPRGGIVHRDIKSPNVLLFHGGNSTLITKICDFGIAHLADISISNFDECPDGGTIRWMSPEGITHDPSEFDSKTDVYSFGMLLFELCTRLLPFHQLQWQQIMMAVALHNQRPEFPSNSREDVRSIVEVCWSAEPEARPDMESVCKLLTTVTKNHGN